MFYYKIHRSRGKVLLAACDADLLGKRFEEGRKVLFLSAEFYGGEKAGGEIADLFHKADIINIAGDKIVSIALKNKWVSAGGVIRIEGVPHAQIIIL